MRSGAPQAREKLFPIHAGETPALPGRLGSSIRGILDLAEREGFEPSVRLPLHTLSKRAPSTTRTPLPLLQGAHDCMSQAREPQALFSATLIYL
jgi:hypothetical protein